MSIEIDLQIASQCTSIPSESYFHQWTTSIPSTHTAPSVCIRIVDEEESKDLNHKFRNIDRPTNVLSFPSDIPDEVDLDFLGDVVICAPLVQSQANEQNKKIEDHWAHLVIHGILHLQGYDHQNQSQAEQMESIEITLLDKLGIKNPYK